jgi:HD-GYP domain-containing protein (c-di-GMP phosphodiesterase class II)
MSIFKLSRQLNATTELDALLDLIVDVTFEAFDAANFFAITLFSEEQLDDDDLGRVRPLIARDRDPSTSMDGTPLLSSSLLKRVASSRESVLFVRDEAGEDVTESIINARISACLAAPLVGQNKLIGVMQADTRGRGSLFAADDLDLFTVMASYAAFAIERVRLSKNIVDMFDGIVQASVSAIDARDPATAGHSHRVADMTVALAERVNHAETGPLASLSFSPIELQELRYAALLHDFGKIGVRESVLVKAERLYPRQRGELCQRFETVKASLAVRRHRRLLKQLASTNEVPDASTLEALECEIGRVTGELDELLDYILRHQALERIDSSVVTRIREIGDLTYTDLDGETHPYLSDEEIESLCILFGTLTDQEIEHIRSHASLSRDYLSHIPWSDQLEQIPCIAGWHHEKLDGSGYPDGISGDAIAPQVRMLTICDIFDALTAVDRPYRRAVSVPAALEVLREEGEQGLLDLDLLAIFAQMISERLEPQRSKASQR